jgi:drug/metabolite transporter (DMT)-like permease
MFLGVLFSLAAGLMWGLIFVGPVLVPDYPAVLQSTGRYVALGLFALPLAWFDRRRLRQLRPKDWLEALKLSIVGNLLYYLCLASAIQRTGAPVSTMIIGTLPVAISVTANLLYGHQEGRLSWYKLIPALMLMSIGLVFVNIAELTGNSAPTDIWRYISGLLFAFFGVVCWTWFPLRNARWLRENPDKHPATWATALGVMTLPLALLGYGLASVHLALTQPLFALPFGPRPEVFIPLMIAIGILCSWVGAFCWNQASQRLPTVILGPLLAFETLTGLAYIFILRQSWPPLLTVCGIVFLSVGVIYAMLIKPEHKKTPAIPQPL